MNALTIPAIKKFAKTKDLVVIPRSEYESLKARVVPEYTPTPAERRAIVRARSNYRAGKTVPLSELDRELARRG